MSNLVERTYESRSSPEYDLSAIFNLMVPSPKLSVSLPSIPDSMQPWFNIALFLFGILILFGLSVLTWYLVYKIFFGGRRRALASSAFLIVGLWSGFISPAGVFRYLDSTYGTNPVVTIFMFLLLFAPGLLIAGALMSGPSQEQISANNADAEQYRQWEERQREMG